MDHVITIGLTGLNVLGISMLRVNTFKADCIVSKLIFIAGLQSFLPLIVDIVTTSSDVPYLTITSSGVHNVDELINAEKKEGGVMILELQKAFENIDAGSISCTLR